MARRAHAPVNCFAVSFAPQKILRHPTLWYSNSRVIFASHRLDVCVHERVFSRSQEAALLLSYRKRKSCLTCVKVFHRPGFKTVVPQRGLAVRDIRKLHIGRDLMRIFNFPLISTIRRFLHGLLPASRRAIIRELHITLLSTLTLTRRPPKNRYLTVWEE